MQPVYAAGTGPSSDFCRMLERTSVRWSEYADVADVYCGMLPDSSLGRSGVFSRPYLLLTLAVLFWAGNFVLGRAVRAEIPPIGLAFWRWCVATLILWPFAWPHLRREWRTMRRHLLVILLLAALGVGSFNTLIYSGLQFTVALNALLLQSLLPLGVVLFSGLFFREVVSPRQLGGIALSLLGAALIIFRGDLRTLLAFSLNPGDVLIIVAVVAYAAYTAFLRKRPSLHPLSFLLATFAFGTLMIFPFYLAEMAAGRFVTINFPTVGSVLYVAIFPSIVSYLFYNRGVELLGANRAGLFAHLMPLFGGILSVVLLGEGFRWFHLLGAVLILSGIALATLSVRPSPAVRGSLK